MAVMAVAGGEQGVDSSWVPGSSTPAGSHCEASLPSKQANHMRPSLWHSLSCAAMNGAPPMSTSTDIRLHEMLAAAASTGSWCCWAHCCTAQLHYACCFICMQPHSYERPAVSMHARERNKGKEREERKGEEREKRKETALFAPIHPPNLMGPYLGDQEAADPAPGTIG